MVVVVIIGVMGAVAAPSMRFMRSDQALRSTARSVADTFMLARSQAIKTGNNVIVVFQGASGNATPVGLQTTNIMDIIDDGVAASADCTITGDSEVVWSNVPSDDNDISKIDFYLVKSDSNQNKNLVRSFLKPGQK